MLKKITSLILSSESLIIFCLFLFFQFLRTQTMNLSYYVFDQLFLDGIVSSIYQYNYAGKLLGCEQLLEMKGKLASMSTFQKEGLHFFQYIPSLIAFILLISLKSSSRFVYWLLVVITCFSVLNAIIMLSYMIRIDHFNTIKDLRNLISTCIFLVIGIYVFLKVFKLRQRLQIIFVGLPAFYIGTFLWFKYIGPRLLPVVL